MFDEMITENFSKPWQRLLADLAESAVLPVPTEEMEGKCLQVVKMAEKGDAIVPPQSVTFDSETAEVYVEYDSVPEGGDVVIIDIDGTEIQGVMVDDVDTIYCDFCYDTYNMSFNFLVDDDPVLCTVYFETDDELTFNVSLYTAEDVYKWKPGESSSGESYDAEFTIDQVNDGMTTIEKGSYEEIAALLEQNIAPRIKLTVIGTYNRCFVTDDVAITYFAPDISVPGFTMGIWLYSYSGSKWQTEYYVWNSNDEIFGD